MLQGHRCVARNALILATIPSASVSNHIYSSLLPVTFSISEDNPSVGFFPVKARIVNYVVYEARGGQFTDKALCPNTKSSLLWL